MAAFIETPSEPKKPGNWAGIAAWKEANPEAATAGQIKGARATQARFDLVAECRKLAPSALKALAEALHGKSLSLRVEAASILLDRGFGRAAQLIEYAGEVEFRLSSLDDDTLEGLIRERIRGLGLSVKHSPALPAVADLEGGNPADQVSRSDSDLLQETSPQDEPGELSAASGSPLPISRPTRLPLVTPGGSNTTQGTGRPGEAVTPSMERCVRAQESIPPSKGEAVRELNP